MFAVLKKEFRSSLCGMTGPIFIFAALLIFGFFTSFYQFRYAVTNFEYAIVDGAFWSLLLAPILTMRSFSEERKSRTDQLLYSLPITTTEIVMGKYLGMVAIFAIPCAVTCVYPLIVSAFASDGINFAICYGAILAYFLLGCAIIAICMLISSLFESQVICAILNLAIILAFYFITKVQIPSGAGFSLGLLIVIAIAAMIVVYFVTKNYITTAVAGILLAASAIAPFVVDSTLYEGLGAKIVAALYLFQPITAFAQGVFDITCLVYYLSIAALFVFVTVQSFERRRWN